MMRALTQTIAVTWMNIANLRNRLLPSLVAIAGIAGVVMVTVGVASVVFGLSAAVRDNTDPRTVIVTRAAATGEMDSTLSNDEVSVIVEGPGIESGADGAMVSPEMYMVLDMPRRGTGTSSNVPIRGVGENALAVRGNARISEGRMLTPGLNEIVVGKGARSQFDGLDIGDIIQRGENTWTVVGVLDSGGGIPDGEVWADARVLQGAYRRGNSWQSVRARLVAPDRLVELRDALNSDPRVNIKITTEQEFYADNTRTLRMFTSTVGVAVGVLMALGAVFTAMNTMYSAVAARAREIATLRALGFGGGAVLTSVLAESALLGLIGGTLGGALAYLIFNGLNVATLNFDTFTQIAFSFAVTPKLLGIGIGFALVMGLVGGALPGIRASLMPIAAALREL